MGPWRAFDELCTKHASDMAPVLETPATRGLGPSHAPGGTAESAPRRTPRPLRSAPRPGVCSGRESPGHPKTECRLKRRGR